MAGYNVTAYSTENGINGIETINITSLEDVSESPTSNKAKINDGYVKITSI